MSLAFSQENSLSASREKAGFHNVKIGINLIRAGKTHLGTNNDTKELELELGVNGSNFVFDYGTEKHDRISGYIYSNEGSYYRLGIDRNFIKRPSKGNVLSLGLRYARAGFEDELIYTLNNGFGDQNFNLSNPDLKARWIELVFNLRGKIVSQLYMGFTLRWKFSRKISGENELKTYDVPGFGNTSRENATSIDYYLMWRIPFKKRTKDT